MWAMPVSSALVLGTGVLFAASGAASAASLAVVTIGVAFAILIVVGFAVLMRRSRRTARASGPDELGMRANQALVRLDDEIAESVAELGYAEAQFGTGRSAEFAAAIGSARELLTTAFAVKQRLDDHLADTASERRESSARILLLCQTGLEKLARERAVFDTLRGLERTAAADLDGVRAQLAQARAELPGATALLAELTRRYAPSATAPVSENIAQATRLIETSDKTAADAAVRLDPAGVGDAASDIHTAERDVVRARQLLTDIGAHGDRLTLADTRLENLLDSTRGEVDRAREARDHAGAGVSAAAGSAIADSIAYVERTLQTVTTDRRDPEAAIARIDGTLDALDTALAAARSQEQRLAHARDALTGALFTARSQIEVTTAYIAGRRGGAGADARSRLAEAERLLAVAEAESDPVVALDTARSSATYSRDADALARYDLLH